MSKTSIYICSDSTLTYGPYGGRKKIIRQALPVAVVDSPETAERLIQTVGSKSKPIPANDPDFKQALGKRKIEEGYGPTWRYHYSLADFKRHDVSTVMEVRKTFDLLVEGKTKEAFARSVKHLDGGANNGPTWKP